MGAEASKCCTTGGNSTEHEQKEICQPDAIMSTSNLQFEAQIQEPQVVAKGAAKVETPVAEPVPPPTATTTTTEGEYAISLNKTAGSRLGVDVDHQDGATLLIEAVTGGLVDAWNDANPDLKVKQGDRVVEVNGIRGDVLQLVEECKKNQVLNMKLKKG